VKRTCKAASVANKLWMANTSIQSAKLSAAYALRVSRGEMSGKPGKGTMQSRKTYTNFKADNLERQHLKMAQVALTRASALLAEVQEDDPEIKGFVVPEGLADGSSLAGKLDAWINTPATSLLFHAEIKETVEIVAQIESIDDKVSAWESRVEKLSVERSSAGEALTLAREKLQRLRAQIFEQILREGSGATPAYEEPLTAREAPPPYS
jgi:hypothetical protein